MKVPFSYITEQFADAEELFRELRELVSTGDFTLGSPVREFETLFSERVGARHAIGVNSGTDALKLSLKAIGLGPGDEVITAANTFVATVGAISEIGAHPVLVDCDDSFCLDVDRLEDTIGDRTKAIVPVHLTGNMVDMPRIMEIAARHGVAVVEDACQAIGSTLDGKAAGTWGITGAFSLHPLKFVNVWGDGGVIVTSDDEVAARLQLLRNHGLFDRDTVKLLGYNSRLDSVQAIVAKWVIPKSEEIVRLRNENAAFYDSAFTKIPEVRVPPRRAGNPATR